MYQRSDDQSDVIRRRIQVYDEQTAPILQHYKEKNVPFIVSSITALETKQESVVQGIIAELKKLNLA